MATAAEYWYVRLPDGRTLRRATPRCCGAMSRAGRIPRDSQVRRSGEDTWVPLQHATAFADLLAAATDQTEAGNAGGAELRTLGMRGLVEELFIAFDSSLNHAKLTIAALTGVMLAVGLIAFDQIASLPPGLWSVVTSIAMALLVLAVAAVATVLLTQMTFIELDRHRPAHAAEVTTGLLRQGLRVLFAQGLVTGVLVGLVLLVRAAGPWLAAHEFSDNRLGEATLGVLTVLRLLLAVVCWPILGLAVLLLGPLLVIEEYSIARSLREWLGMLRRHLGRIYLYEALAFTLATVLALPMLLLVGVAAYSVGDAPSPVERITLLVLAGLALTPLIAYLIVANVFIYLNLRYEFFYTARNP